MKEKFKEIFNRLEALEKLHPELKPKPTQFYCKNSKGGNAVGIINVEERSMKILKGSSARLFTTPSCPEGILKHREKLLDSKIITSTINNTLVFTESTSFKSPSMASSIILGAASSGLLEWKTDKGEELGDIYPELRIKTHLV